MRHLCNRLQVRHIVSRIANRLHIHSLCPVVNQPSKVCRIIAGDEFGLNAEAGKEDFELVIRAAVKVRCRDDVIARFSQCADGHELGSLAGRSCDCGDATFKSGHAFFKDGKGGLFGIFSML